MAAMIQVTEAKQIDKKKYLQESNLSTNFENKGIDYYYLFWVGGNVHLKWFTYSMQ